MVRKKLKINFQRIVALACACIIAFAGFVGFLAVPAYAVSVLDASLGFGLLMDSNSVLPSLPDITVPASGFLSYFDSSYVNRPFSSFVSSNAGSTLTVNFSDSLEPSSFVLFNNSNLAVDYAYMRFLPSDLYDSEFVALLSSFGRLVQFRNGYVFNDHIVTIPRISLARTSLSNIFSVDDVSYNSIRIFYSFSTAFLTYEFIVNGVVSSSLLVYDLSLDRWVDDSYRSLTFDYFIPNDFELALFMLENEAPPPSFIDRLGAGFMYSIGWLGDFFTSLFTSNLALAFVLISVGFGLALLSFGWRWIRRWLWGY